MVGFPKLIATRQDVERLLQSHPIETKSYLERELDQTKRWEITGTLASAGDGVTDDTHRVLTEQSLEDGSEVIYQQGLRDDPGCKLARLRITVDEALQWCASSR